MRLPAAAALAAALAGCAGSRPPPPPAPPPPLTALEIHDLGNPHQPGKRACVACHLTDGGRELRAAPIQTCRQCHRASHQARGEHPVDVVQARAAPGLPLLPGNRVACHTCHDAHDMKRHEGGLRMEFNALCTTCHPRGSRGQHH